MSEVCLTAETYQRIAEYAAIFGVSVEYAANKAIQRWMDASGEIAMEVHLDKRKAKSPVKATPKRIFLLTGTDIPLPAAQPYL